jgi:hypothetical protein
MKSKKIVISIIIGFIAIPILALIWWLASNYFLIFVYIFVSSLIAFIIYNLWDEL